MASKCGDAILLGTPCPNKVIFSESADELIILLVFLNIYFLFSWYLIAVLKYSYFAVFFPLWACIMFPISICLPFCCAVLMWQSRKQKVGEKPLLARSTFIQVVYLIDLFLIYLYWGNIAYFDMYNCFPLFFCHAIWLSDDSLFGFVGSS